MTTFVDTSALFALIDEADPAHDAALSWIEDVATTEDERLLTHNYVVVETTALVHSRLRAAAVRMLIDDILPVCEVRYIDQELHERGTASFLAGLNRKVSFVDRMSFELMREEGIRRAFAFDPDFPRAGFETVP